MGYVHFGNDYSEVSERDSCFGFTVFGVDLFRIDVAWGYYITLSLFGLWVEYKWKQK